MINELFADSIFFGFAVSLLGYMSGLALNKRVKFLNPLLSAIIFVIVFLCVFKIDYKSYEKGAAYLSYFLTPSTVCLAVPLYRQMHLLKKHGAAIAAGIVSGVLTALLCVFIMCALFGLPDELYVTLLPKSITTAIGMDLAAKLGGVPEIAVAVIVITGIFGSAIGEYVLRLFKIDEPVAAGLALGTSAHAIGTSKALELGEVQGAMSSLSITVAGLLTVIFASFFAGLI
jgi:predicted murein hydrolase (TIGR00659 family)